MRAIKKLPQAATRPSRTNARNVSGLVDSKTREQLTRTPRTPQPVPRHVSGSWTIAVATTYVVENRTEDLQRCGKLNRLCGPTEMGRPGPVGHRPRQLRLWRPGRAGARIRQAPLAGRMARRHAVGVAHLRCLACAWPRTRPERRRS